jgi:hypothetical protein
MIVYDVKLLRAREYSVSLLVYLASPFGLIPGYYINNILSDLLHAVFYSLVSFAHGGPSLGLIYILDRLAPMGNNFIFSTTNGLSTRTFAAEDKNISANIMIVNPYPIPFCILIYLDFLKYSHDNIQFVWLEA